MTFNFTTTEKGKYCIIKLSGNLMEKAQANELLDEVNTCILRDIKSFIIDFSDFQFMNSSGLTVMLNILTKSRKAGGETIICNVNKKLKEVFSVTRLTDVFEIADSEQAAEAAI
ncbi:MAG: STAS domain-containing protein [Bacteroidetes bacterium]|jgi:anti-sigma B factor antagonist|nr:STAS domain-containing protein [Bacteroidota bacterium]